MFRKGLSRYLARRYSSPCAPACGAKMNSTDNSTPPPVSHPKHSIHRTSRSPSVSLPSSVRSYTTQQDGESSKVGGKGTSTPTPQEIHQVIVRSLATPTTEGEGRLHRYHHALNLLLGALQLNIIPSSETYELLLTTAVRLYLEEEKEKGEGEGLSSSPSSNLVWELLLLLCTSSASLQSLSTAALEIMDAELRRGSSTSSSSSASPAACLLEQKVVPFVEKMLQSGEKDRMGNDMNGRYYSIIEANLRSYTKRITVRPLQRKKLIFLCEALKSRESLLDIVNLIYFRGSTTHLSTASNRENSAEEAVMLSAEEKLLFFKAANVLHRWEYLYYYLVVEQEYHLVSRDPHVKNSAFVLYEPLIGLFIDTVLGAMKGAENGNSHNNNSNTDSKIGAKSPFGFHYIPYRQIIHFIEHNSEEDNTSSNDNNGESAFLLLLSESAQEKFREIMKLAGEAHCDTLSQIKSSVPLSPFTIPQDGDKGKEMEVFLERMERKDIPLSECVGLLFHPFLYPSPDDSVDPTVYQLYPRLVDYVLEQLLQNNSERFIFFQVLLEVIFSPPNESRVGEKMERFQRFFISNYAPNPSQKRLFFASYCHFLRTVGEKESSLTQPGAELAFQLLKRYTTDAGDVNGELSARETYYATIYEYTLTQVKDPGPMVRLYMDHRLHLLQESLRRRRHGGEKETKGMLYCQEKMELFLLDVLPQCRASGPSSRWLNAIHRYETTLGQLAAPLRIKEIDALKEEYQDKQWHSELLEILNPRSAAVIEKRKEEDLAGGSTNPPLGFLAQHWRHLVRDISRQRVVLSKREWITLTRLVWSEIFVSQSTSRQQHSGIQLQVNEEALSRLTDLYSLLQHTWDRKITFSPNTSVTLLDALRFYIDLIQQFRGDHHPPTRSLVSTLQEEIHQRMDRLYHSSHGSPHQRFDLFVFYLSAVLSVYPILQPHQLEETNNNSNKNGINVSGVNVVSFRLLSSLVKEIEQLEQRYFHAAGDGYSQAQKISSVEMNFLFLNLPVLYKLIPVIIFQQIQLIYRNASSSNNNNNINNKDRVRYKLQEVDKVIYFFLDSIFYYHSESYSPSSHDGQKTLSNWIKVFSLLHLQEAKNGNVNSAGNHKDGEKTNMGAYYARYCLRRILQHHRNVVRFKESSTTPPSLLLFPLPLLELVLSIEEMEAAPQVTSAPPPPNRLTTNQEEHIRVEEWKRITLLLLDQIALRSNIDGGDIHNTSHSVQTLSKVLLRLSEKFLTLGDFHMSFVCLTQYYKETNNQYYNKDNNNNNNSGGGAPLPSSTSPPEVLLHQCLQGIKDELVKRDTTARRNALEYHWSVFMDRGDTTNGVKSVPSFRLLKNKTVSFDQLKSTVEFLLQERELEPLVWLLTQVFEGTVKLFYQPSTDPLSLLEQLLFSPSFLKEGSDLAVKSGDRCEENTDSVLIYFFDVLYRISSHTTDCYSIDMYSLWVCFLHRIVNPVAGNGGGGGGAAAAVRNRREALRNEMNHNEIIFQLTRDTLDQIFFALRLQTFLPINTPLRQDPLTTEAYVQLLSLAMYLLKDYVLLYQKLFSPGSHPFLYRQILLFAAQSRGGGVDRPHPWSYTELYCLKEQLNTIRRSQHASQYNFILHQYNTLIEAYCQYHSTTVPYSVKEVEEGEGHRQGQLDGVLLSLIQPAVPTTETEHPRTREVLLYRLAVLAPLLVTASHRQLEYLCREGIHYPKTDDGGEMPYQPLQIKALLYHYKREIFSFIYRSNPSNHSEDGTPMDRLFFPEIDYSREDFSFLLTQLSTSPILLLLSQILHEEGCTVPRTPPSTEESPLWANPRIQGRIQREVFEGFISAENVGRLLQFVLHSEDKRKELAKCLKNRLPALVEEEIKMNLLPLSPSRGKDKFLLTLPSHPLNGSWIKRYVSQYQKILFPDQNRLNSFQLYILSLFVPWLERVRRNASSSSTPSFAKHQASELAVREIATYIYYNVFQQLMMSSSRERPADSLMPHLLLNYPPGNNNNNNGVSPNFPSVEMIETVLKLTFQGLKKMHLYFEQNNNNNNNKNSFHTKIKKILLEDSAPKIAQLNSTLDHLLGDASNYNNNKKDNNSKVESQLIQPVDITSYVLFHLMYPNSSPSSLPDMDGLLWQLGSMEASNINNTLLGRKTDNNSNNNNNNNNNNTRNTTWVCLSSIRDPMLFTLTSALLRSLTSSSSTKLNTAEEETEVAVAKERRSRMTQLLVERVKEMLFLLPGNKNNKNNNNNLSDLVLLLNIIEENKLFDKMDWIHSKTLQKLLIY